MGTSFPYPNGPCNFSMLRIPRVPSGKRYRKNGGLAAKWCETAWEPAKCIASKKEVKWEYGGTGLAHGAGDRPGLRRCLHPSRCLGTAGSPGPCLALVGDSGSRALRLPHASPLTSRPGEVCRARAMATLTHSVNKTQQNNDFLIEISREGKRLQARPACHKTGFKIFQRMLKPS